VIPKCHCNIPTSNKDWTEAKSPKELLHEWFNSNSFSQLFNDVKFQTYIPQNSAIGHYSQIQIPIIPGIDQNILKTISISTTKSNFTIPCLIPSKTKKDAENLCALLTLHTLHNLMKK